MTDSIRSDQVSAFVQEQRESLIGFLCEITSIDSVTGNEDPIARHCSGWLEKNGIKSVLQPVKGRHNVISSVGDGPDTMVIAGHLDTVPANADEWSSPPLTPTLRDGKLFGLGTSDLKASIASAYFASLFFKLHPIAGRLVSVFTIEEETTGDGTRSFLEWAAETSFLNPEQTVAIVSEPTGLTEVSLGSRGALWIVVTVRGRGGHGSRPHRALNPIDRCREMLDELALLAESWNSTYPDPDFPGTSITPTSLNAGNTGGPNVIPETATMVLDCRPTPALSEGDFALIRNDLTALFERHSKDGFEVSWEERTPRPGHKLEQDHPLAQLALDVLRTDLNIDSGRFVHTSAGNDACFFGQRGIPTINKVGPGHPECAHTVDEYVTVDNVVLGLEYYIRLAARHFGAL